jgi:tetratricopeptide (TPR) repeat protein
MLANIDLAEGASEKAKTDLRSAIAANPQDMASYLGLAFQYQQEENWDEAIKVCEKAHQVNPASPAVADHLALLYLDHGGNVNVALSLAETAKQKTPNSPLAADALGWAYYKLGSQQSAITELKQGVQQAPRIPTIRYHLGMAYLAAGQPDLAREALQAALQENPKFPQAADAEAALQKLPK